MSVLQRNNVQVRGRGDRAMLFAHGFGCDQNMWRFVAPAFEQNFRIVPFDHVGAGGSDLAAYRRDKYSNLQGYADDLVEISKELDLADGRPFRQRHDWHSRRMQGVGPVQPCRAGRPVAALHQ